MSNVYRVSPQSQISQCAYSQPFENSGALQPAQVNGFTQAASSGTTSSDPNSILGVLRSLVDTLAAVVNQIASLFDVGPSAGAAQGANPGVSATSAFAPSSGSLSSAFNRSESTAATSESGTSSGWYEKVADFATGESGAKFADKVSGWYDGVVDWAGEDSWIGQGLEKIGAWVGSGWDAVTSWF